MENAAKAAATTRGAEKKKNTYEQIRKNWPPSIIDRMPPNTSVKIADEKRYQQIRPIFFSRGKWKPRFNEITFLHGNFDANNAVACDGILSFVLS